MKYEAKMDAQAVLPFQDDLQSANNGVLRCQCQRRFIDKFKHGLPAAQAYRNLVELQSFTTRDIRIQERRAGPRKSSLKTKALRETVEVQHNSDVHELAPRLEKYDSTASRHFAQIETTRKKRVAECIDLVLRQEERPVLH
ncbi:hypothetical protein M514_11892 [Trichuris suis]|uniref:Uncharacterized protein n=1 Tax=Trichuris suis TaxID=68888 RepID=A0A085N6Z4_9BILA|nr:hypothetical protein M514_11892 [Trichuris suis]